MVDRRFTIWATREVHDSSAVATKSLQSCSTLCDPIDPTRLLCPWDSPGNNTGVGCHFLLQCMKVKSECEVAQSFPTLSDPMDCSLPGFSIHGIFQARGLEWGAIAFSDDSSRSYQILVNSSNTLETSERCAMWIRIRYHQCTFTCHCRRALVLKHCYKKKQKC